MRARTRDAKTKKRRFPRFTSHVRRRCRFCKNNINYVDYKDIKMLEKFITEKGKITSRRFSGNCAKHQRLIAGVIKKARFIALLPYIK